MLPSNLHLVLKLQRGTNDNKENKTPPEVSLSAIPAGITFRVY